MPCHQHPLGIILHLENGWNSTKQVLINSPSIVSGSLILSLKLPSAPGVAVIPMAGKVPVMAANTRRWGPPALKSAMNRMPSE